MCTSKWEHITTIPELYKCIKLPVFDGVKEVLQKYNVQENWKV